MDERRRYEVGSRGHGYLVEGSVLGPTVIAIGDSQLNVRAALLTKPTLCLSPKLFDDLDAVHLASELCQDCGMVAQSSSDLEHGIVGADIEQIRHQADDEWL